MRISAIEPSSVVISKIKYSIKTKRLKSDDLKCQINTSQKGWCNIPTQLQFGIIAQKPLNRYESTEVDRRTWLHVASVTIGPPPVTLNKI